MKNPFIPAAELNFDAYKDSLKEYLRTQHNFTDYDFEGSNISVLIDLLTYNTYNNALYLNMVGSEAWVDSAQLRSSLVSHSKDLNYVPRSMSSAQCTITVEITPPDTPPIITIPAYYKFRTNNSNGEILHFVTGEDITIARDENGRYIARDITVYEGSMIEEFYVVNDITEQNGYYTYSQDFVIASENVDVNSIEVFVNDVPFERAANLFGISSIDQIYFVTGWMENQYKIEFGDGVFGTNLNLNDTIKIRYRNTKGDEVSGNYILTSTNDIQGYSDISVYNISRATGGGSRESIESIRYSAPRYFQTQERAVVPQDYEILIKNRFPFVQDISVFGGEEIYQYGKVMIVIKPYGHTGNISNNLKNQIIEFVKTKNKITEPVILNPEFYYIRVNGNVFYSDVNDISVRTLVNNALMELSNTELSAFNTHIFQSMINHTISSASNKIVGNDVEISLVRQWTPRRGAPETNIFVCDNPVVSVRTNIFNIWHNQQAIPAMVTDEDGYLHLNAVVGNELIRLSNSIVGTVNYETGEVQVTLEAYDYTNSIDFIITPREDSVHITRDKFVLLDSKYFELDFVKR